MAKKGIQQPPAADEPSFSGRPELSNVMYIGHLPHGFYEEQLQGFFSQFGKVTRLRMSRNKKTGKSKHYAFLEFLSPEVAAIAAEAMDGYMLFTQKLDCHVLPVAAVHKDLFKGANRKFRKVPWRNIEQTRHNKERTEEEEGKRLARAVRRDQKRLAKIEALGIGYTYELLESKTAAEVNGAMQKDKGASKPAKRPAVKSADQGLGKPSRNTEKAPAAVKPEGKASKLAKKSGHGSDSGNGPASKLQQECTKVAEKSAKAGKAGQSLILTAQGSDREKQKAGKRARVGVKVADTKGATVIGKGGKKRNRVE